MKFAETLKLAIAAIWAHKLRSALTLLGMIIGVTAFVVVVSLISGFNKYIDEKIAGIGSKSFTVQRFNFEDFKDLDSIAAAQRRNKELTLDDYEYLKARGTTIDKIGAKARASRSLVKRGSTFVEDVPVDGAMPVIGEIDNIDVAYGRYFTDSENDGAMRVAFIGMDVANALFSA
ncbi:MAG TPA: ABC transporter permease, partial [Pyrinomonadaceae bacterium]|nr:ABC transporter permease [Pyrinomonadaceae bacterium]